MLTIHVSMPMRNLVSKTLLTTLLTLILGIATISDTTSSARASLADDLDIIVSPFGRATDSLRALSVRLDYRLDDLSAIDSSLFSRLMLPVISPELRTHLETMSYFQPIIVTPSQDDTHLTTRVDAQQRYIDLILSSIESRRSLAVQLPTLTPTTGSHTSSFGYRIHPISGRVKMHEGIDLSSPTGTPIHASGNGVVTFAGRRNGYGNTVQIAHSYGYATLYGHCSKLLVKEGDTVQQGDVIALVGSTGASTGPHLHYEVSVDGTKVAPDGFLLDKPVRPVEREESAIDSPAPKKRSAVKRRKRR